MCGQQKSKDVFSLTAKLKFGVSVVRFAPGAAPEQAPRLTPATDDNLVYGFFGSPEPSG